MKISKLYLAFLSLGVTSTQVLAQGDLFIEEVLVTARKQTETIQDVPISLTAFDSREIGLQGVEKTEDVIKLAPGLTFTKGIGGQDTRPDIRGVTPLSGRANVAILVDGIDITSDALVGTGAGQLTTLGLYDIERIEVVRGPQSALFGRNAFGGAINYITKKPSASFEGTFSAEIAQFGTRKGKLSLSGPISDNLLYRVNLSQSRTDGQYDDQITGKDYGGDKTSAASIALQFLPSDTLEILTRLDWSDQDGDLAAKGTLKPTNCVEARLDTRATDVPCTAPNAKLVTRGTISSTDEIFIAASDDEFLGVDNKLVQFTALVNWELSEDYTFTSNTSYTQNEGEDDYDLDHLPTITAIDPPNGISRLAFPWVNADNPFNYHNDSVSDRNVFFQDFRLSYDAFESVRWLIGAEYYNEDFQVDNYQRANGSVERGDNGNLYTGPLGTDPNTLLPVTGTVAVQLPINQERETTAYGFYASFDWQFLDSWELSLSGRYQYEKYSGEVDAVYPAALVPTQASNLPAFGPDFPAVLTYDDEFYAFNPRVVLTHYLNDSVMLFGSISQGTKPGGFTADIDLTPQSFQFDQEKLTAYEFGWKTSWLNDRVFINGALFFNDNTDKQASTNDYSTRTGTPRPYTANIGESESYGLELQISGVIATGWTANLNYAYTETEIKEYWNDNALGIPAPLPSFLPGAPTPEEAKARALSDPDADQSGKELPYTPKHSLNLSTNYEFAVSDQLDAFIRVDYRLMSERWISTNNLAKLDNYDIWDLKAGLIHPSWELVAFVDNVADDETISSAINFVNFTENFDQLLVAYPASKRTSGLRFKYFF